MKEYIKNWGAVGQMVIIAFVIAVGLLAIRYVYCCPESMDLVTTIATTVIAATAVIAAFYSYWQYAEEREKRIKNDTIELMSISETDPVLYKVERRLNKIRRNNNNDLSKVEDMGELQFLLSKTLNFYEGMAYKTLTGIVDRGTVEEQYKNIIIRHVKLFIKGEKYGGIIPPKNPGKDGKSLFPYSEAKKSLPNLMKLYEQLETPSA